DLQKAPLKASGVCPSREMGLFDTLAHLVDVPMSCRALKGKSADLFGPIPLCDEIHALLAVVLGLDAEDAVAPDVPGFRTARFEQAENGDGREHLRRQHDTGHMGIVLAPG